MCEVEASHRQGRRERAPQPLLQTLHAQPERLHEVVRVPRRTGLYQILKCQTANGRALELAQYVLLGGTAGQAAQNSSQMTASCTVLVEGLSDTATTPTLNDYFCFHGKIEKVVVDSASARVNPGIWGPRSHP
jgi:hypothetical protein